MACGNKPSIGECRETFGLIWRDPFHRLVRERFARLSFHLLTNTDFFQEIVSEDIGP